MTVADADIAFHLSSLLRLCAAVYATGLYMFYFLFEVEHLNFPRQLGSIAVVQLESPEASFEVSL